MRLTRLELDSFRNIASARLDFEGDRHFFLGGNGQGKTNILEALAYAGTLDSFRTKKREALVMEGRPEAVIRSHWQHEKRGETVLGVAITPSSRRATLDNEPIKTVGELSGVFPVVALTLADRALIYGGPESRREEIDRLIAQMDPAYRGCLFEYEKAVRSRNQLLQAEPFPSPKEFEAFESVMAATARRIIKSRQRAVELLMDKFSKAFASFAPAKEIPGLIYAPNALAEELEKLWLELREGKDRALGHTSKGPHRDNLLITLNGLSAELYASEGQKFSLVLAIKLAGLQLLYEKLRIAPVLVCDDLLLELDPARQKAFWASVGNLQVFASGTIMPTSESGKWKIWQVEEGRARSA
jgi:DNA replication and repair protein RecF